MKNLNIFAVSAMFANVSVPDSRSIFPTVKIHFRKLRGTIPGNVCVDLYMFVDQTNRRTRKCKKNRTNRQCSI